MQKKNQIIKVEKKVAEREGGIGKYLNKHIAPGNMYVVEDDANLMGSCLYNIDSPMMVITYKSYEQFIKEATRSEIEANLTESEKENTIITDELIAEKQLELVDKAIKFDDKDCSLDLWTLFNFKLQMNDKKKVVLIDNYQSIVEDWYQESPNGPIQTILQKILKEYEITLIASKHPSIIENEEQVEMQEPVLWITSGWYGMVRQEVEEINIRAFRKKDLGITDGIGASLKHILEPSQFYIVEKKPEVASSFYYSLFEPSAIFTLTKRTEDFLYEMSFELSKNKIQIGCYTGNSNMNGITVSIQENRPMWIDDTEIHSVKELCEKCRQMKIEHQIQFAVIDDFQHLPLPKRVLEGRVNRDEVYQQLCLLATELNIVVLAFNSSSTDSEDIY